MNRRRQRGEGMTSYLIVLALVVLACVAGAQFLGQEIMALIVGGQGPVSGLEGKVDRVQITEQPPSAPPETEEEEEEEDRP